MGTRDFINKFRLDKVENFPYDKFLKEFEREFKDTMEAMGGYENMKNCRFCINTMKTLWDNINQEAYKPLPEFLWKKFYRDTVAPEREKVKGFDPSIIERTKLKLQK